MSAVTRRFHGALVAFAAASTLAVAGCGRIGFGLLHDAGGSTDAAPRADGEVPRPDGAPDGGVADAPGIDASAADALDVAAGAAFSCVARGGQVYCWGDNTSGQLGDGTTMLRGTPALVTGITTATRITAGSDHACALLSSGQIHCWGSRANGKLGDGMSLGIATMPGPVVGVESATGVSCGEEHCCATHRDQTASCWGKNIDGQLGDGTTTERSTPTVIRSLTRPVRHIASGLGHTCAAVAIVDFSGDEMYCWGANTRGQVGNGAVGSILMSPVRVAAIPAKTWYGVSAGLDHTCAGAIGCYCWGANDYGQLGDGTAADSPVPTTVDAPLDISSITTGVGSHTCSGDRLGGAHCWGRNERGQLGDGTTTDRRRPVVVRGITDTVHIAAGRAHTCAVAMTSRVVLCWGANDRGQVGDGTLADRLTPVPLSIP